jgi:hypothetical protein
MRIGVISDTHGLLRPEVVRFLKTCDHIIHAGDIGSEEIVKELRAIAPLTIVRGNMDRESWDGGLSNVETPVIRQKAFCVVHNIHSGDVSIEPGDFDVVIYGHSHKAEIERKNRTVFLNPGSAGTGHFGLHPSYAVIDIKGSTVKVEIEPLD